MERYPAPASKIRNSSCYNAFICYNAFMFNKKIKIPLLLLVIDILAIFLMYGYGAYKDLSEQCTGLAGASSPCVEEYFYGFLIFAYIIGITLISIIVINWIATSSKDGRKSKK